MIENGNEFEIKRIKAKTSVKATGLIMKKKIKGSKIS